MIQILFLAVSFGASVIGSICGIGGGIIIKPVLDATGMYSVSTISFMSSCIVLAMTTYSVLKVNLAHESVIERGSSTYLGIGAALGGILGKRLFEMVAGGFPSEEIAGAIQSAALLLVVLATGVYTVFRGRVQPKKVKNPVGCIVIGFLLGLLSSFLGIGGGPINLMVLHYFFSMETKGAAQNSLYVILLSQIASLLFSFATNTVPDFPVPLFIGMSLCGILGGMVGHAVNRRIDNRMVDRLFLGLLVIIMGICCYNFAKFV